MLRADNLRQTIMGFFYKKSLTACLTEVKNMNECIIFEVSIKNKREYVVSVYRLPGQTQDKFDIFLINLEQLIGNFIAKNPLFVLITGDFNARSTNCWKNDLSTSESTEVDSLTSSYRLSQIIFDPTHILSNSSSCIDVIFTNQANLVTETRVYLS